MPEISWFFGISIYMYPQEHPPAHFHAFYQDFEVIVEIELGIVEGRFPPKQLKQVLEWLDLHREELMENWKDAIAHKRLRKIEPLK